MTAPHMTATRSTQQGDSSSMSTVPNRAKSPQAADTRKDRRRKFVALCAFLLLTYAAAAVGSALTSSALPSWYADLNKPAWTPPGNVIGLVWTILYALMAIAAWLVWRRGGLSGQRPAMVLWLSQLALNTGWSAVFFGLRAPGLALIEILVLLSAVIATTLVFWRNSRTAGALMLPYAAWVAFATFLNWTIWRLNA